MLSIIAGWTLLHARPLGWPEETLTLKDIAVPAERVLIVGCKWVLTAPLPFGENVDSWDAVVTIKDRDGNPVTSLGGTKLNAIHAKTNQAKPFAMAVYFKENTKGPLTIECRVDNPDIFDSFRLAIFEGSDAANVIVPNSKCSIDPIPSQPTWSTTGTVGFDFISDVEDAGFFYIDRAKPAGKENIWHRGLPTVEKDNHDTSSLSFSFAGEPAPQDGASEYRVYAYFGPLADHPKVNPLKWQDYLKSCSSGVNACFHVKKNVN